MVIVLYYFTYYQLITFAGMDSRYTSKQLKQKIISENVDNNLLHYSIVQKPNATMSVFGLFTHERLLIFNQSKGQLFYLNDLKVPFKQKLPKADKDIAFVPLTLITYKIKENTIEIEYIRKNQKNEKQRGDWIFVYKTVELAQQWYKLLKGYKDKVAASKLGNSKIPNLGSNLGFAHDVLNTQLFPQKSGPIQQSKASSEIQSEKRLQSSFKEKTNFIEQKNSVNEYKLQAVGASNLQKSNEKQLEVHRTESLTDNVLGHLLEANLPKSVKNAKNQSQIKSVPQQRMKIGSLAQSKEPRQQNNSRLSQKDLIRSNIPQDKKDIIDSLFTSSPQRVQEPRKFPKFVLRQNAIDWNKKFMQQRAEETIMDFKRIAERAFTNLLSKGITINDTKQSHQVDGIIMTICLRFTNSAAQMKREFRNYHFILESTKDQPILGVPLTCLFQFKGYIAMAKAPFPSEAMKVPFDRGIKQIQKLERYTRILNQILLKADLYELTNCYKPSGADRIFYLDNLLEYLPLSRNEYIEDYTFRPQFILDKINEFILGGERNRQEVRELKIIQGMEMKLVEEAKTLGQLISSQEEPFTDYWELKELLHSHGLNMKYLGQVSANTANKSIKKYLHTVMIAKIAKDHLNEAITMLCSSDPNANIKQLVTNTLKFLLEGKGIHSNELWATLATNFKKSYNISINSCQIIGGFFLLTLMQLIPADYDCMAINKNKQLFKDDETIGNYFIKQLKPKIKCYHRFTKDITDKIYDICKKIPKSKSKYQEIIETLHLVNQPLPNHFSETRLDEYVLSYLSYFKAPKSVKNVQDRLQHLDIYSLKNRQPPNSSTLNVTQQYLYWCLKQQQQNEFKETINVSSSILNYWFDSNHNFQSTIYELLAQYYENKGKNDECINYLKQALSNTIRLCGTHSKATGLKYFQLAQKELRFGRKKDALENFLKARKNLDFNADITGTYGRAQMRISSLYLNNGNFGDCIQSCLEALKYFELLRKKDKALGVQNEHFVCKTYEILTRAYQIGGKWNQILSCALLCARQLNQSENRHVFQQMVKIGITAAIFKNTPDKARTLLGLAPTQSEEKCLDYLMAISKECVLMQMFISKYPNIDRISSVGANYQPNNSKSININFLETARNIVGCLGQDFIQGLIQQKSYQLQNISP